MRRWARAPWAKRYGRHWPLTIRAREALAKVVEDTIGKAPWAPLRGRRHGHCWPLTMEAREALAKVEPKLGMMGTPHQAQTTR
ncbi:unnamed protein product [Ilex paraguariensis]|uniref:Uncharacterized protein n=1 Tax=Ilex paraguariensis TaxID=185542 RepID=A0ABC8TNB4_9AQUA